MDQDRLDKIARRLAASHVSGVTSRRHLLGGAAAAGVGLLAGRQRSSAACPPGSVVGARGRCLCSATGRPPVGGVCPCSPGLDRCGGVCVDTSDDWRNCGGCGVVCPVADSCVAGTCTWDGTVVTLVNNGPG